MERAYDFNPHIFDEDPVMVLKRNIYVHPLHEDDTTGLSDMWLCVVPWLTAKGQHQAAIPADHKLLFD